MLTQQQRQKRLKFHAASFAILLNSLEREKTEEKEEALETIKRWVKSLSPFRSN